MRTPLPPGRVVQLDPCPEQGMKLLAGVFRVYPAFDGMMPSPSRRDVMWRERCSAGRHLDLLRFHKIARRHRLPR